MAIVTVTSSILLGSQAVNAENPTEQLERLICDTIESCQQLSKSIQAQIEELEAKGLKNLSNIERLQFAKLKKHLITTEKSETARTNELIDERLKSQDAKIAELRGVLLYK